MVRGFVYSLVAVSFCLLLGSLWIFLGDLQEEGSAIGGWLLLATFFLVGPLAFGLGYLHHLRRHPREPRWDAELGE